MPRLVIAALLVFLGRAHADYIQDYYYRLEVAHSDDELELRGEKDRIKEVQKLAPFVKEVMARARAAFNDRGFGELEKGLKIGFWPELGDRGKNEGTDLILVDAGLASENPTLTGVLTHEAYHLIQKGSTRGWAFDPKNNEHVLTQIWPDEATATWVTWSVVPDSPVAWEHTGDLTHEYFRNGLFYYDGSHAYNSFTFLCFLQHRTGARDVVRRFYRNGKDLPAPAASIRDLVARIALTPGAPPARPLPLEDLFMEFVAGARWRKDFEPFRSICAGGRFARERERLEEHLGKPGELKVDPKNKVDQLLPYLEGKEKKLSKEFPAASGPALSIVKEYFILRDPSYKDESRLELSVVAKGGAARIIAFPMAKDGTLQPFYGTESRPASVPSWHTLQAAVVLVLDVSADGRVPCTLTATVKPAEAKWRLVAEEFPPSSFSAFSLRSLKLEPGEPLPADSELPKELAQKWIHASVDVAGRALHAYGRFGEDATAWFWPPYLALPPGTHPWKIATKLQDRDIVLEGVLKCPGDPKAKADEAEARREIEEFKKKLEELKPEEEALRKDRELSLAYARGRLARSLQSQGDWKGARATAEEGLASAPESARVDLCEIVSAICLAEGDLEGAVEWGGRAGRDSSHLSYVADAFVWRRDDLKRAWDHAGRYDAAQKAAGQPARGWYMPKSGDDILR